MTKEPLLPDFVYLELIEALKKLKERLKNETE